MLICKGNYPQWFPWKALIQGHAKLTYGPLSNQLFAYWRRKYFPTWTAPHTILSSFSCWFSLHFHHIQWFFYAWLKYTLIFVWLALNLIQFLNESFTAINRTWQGICGLCVYLKPLALRQDTGKRLLYSMSDSEFWLMKHTQIDLKPQRIKF